MSKALDELLPMLVLRRINHSAFQGETQDLGYDKLFGGHVIAQASLAAFQTVEKDRTLSNFTCYFIRPANAHDLIAYEVEDIRNGKSVSLRVVRATQGGKLIFYMTVSYIIKGQGFTHQVAMPDAPNPEKLINQMELDQQLREGDVLFATDGGMFERPIEIRPITLVNPYKPGKQDPVRYYWLRANGKVLADIPLHQALLAYASDFDFLPSALMPHGSSGLDPSLQIGSMNHSMWIHRKFDINQWLLYTIESPCAFGGNGYVRGQIFSQAGDLVASTAQEGVIRPLG